MKDLELFVGYSFGVSKSSAPGKLNERIAKEIASHIPAAGAQDYILGALTQSQRRQLNCISVFGHPEHVSRCCRQTLESTWNVGIPVNREQVVSRTWKTDSIKAPDNWDPDNSQQWIRSYEQWKRHEQ